MTSLREKIGLTTDPLQKKAAEWQEGPSMLQGGPGTGKTHTLLARMAYLISKGVPPSNITYLTISGRGGEAMQDLLRSHQETREAEPHIYVGTPHGYASHFLRKNGAQALGISPNYTIWDDQQALTIISEMMDYFESLEKNGKKLEPGEGIPKLRTSAIIDILHWNELNKARHRQTPHPARDRSWYDIIEFYEREKTRQNVLDINDLVPTAVRAMQQNDNIRQMWNRSRSLHILVDEFHDITPVQYEMINLMTGPTRSIMVASDPNQSIYKWKGSDSNLLNRFREHHRTAPLHLLRANHRSVGSLTKMNTYMTEHQLMTGLGPDREGPIRGEGVRPQVREYQGAIYFMDEQIVRMAQTFNADGIPWEDMAFIYRRRNTGNRIENKLRDYTIPNHIMGDARKQRDSDAYSIGKILALVLNPMDTNALSAAASTKRMVKERRLNSKISLGIARLAKERNSNLIDAADLYLKASSMDGDSKRDLTYITRSWYELDEMTRDPGTTIHSICKRAQSLLQEYQYPRPPMQEPEMSRFLSLAETNARIQNETPREHLSRFTESLATALYPEHRTQENDDPFNHHMGITLTTIHSATSMQWKIVWVVDVNDHDMPGISNEEDALNEEQRIFYVASTRATDRLFYCYSTKASNIQESRPSRFIQSIEDMVDYVTIRDDRPPREEEEKNKAKQEEN